MRLGSSRRRVLPWGLLGASLIAPALVLLPLGETIWQAFHGGAAALEAVLFRPLVAHLLANTTGLIETTMAASAILGVGSAWLIERTDLPGRRGWAVLAASPLAVPPFVTSYAWISLSPRLEGFAGAALVVSAAYYPLVYLPVAAALRGMDPALEESAQTLGVSRFGCFWRVVVPQLRPALTGGILLVALNTLTEFGAFSLLRFRTFTTEIYAAYRTGFTGAETAALALVLMLLCLGCLGADFIIRGRARHARFGGGVKRTPLRYELGPWRPYAIMALGLLNIITLGVPLGMLLYWLTQHGAAAVTPAEVSPQRIIGATLNSVGLGLASAAVTLMLALPLALYAARHRGWLADSLERTGFLAQGMPGIVVALALVSLAIGVAPAFYQSTALLILAYAILFVPLALVGIRSALVQADTRLEDAARSLGTGFFATIRRITLPLAAPGLGAAAALVFIATVTELTSTLLLAPLGTRTLATELWADGSTLAFAAAAPFAAIMTFISIIATWLFVQRFGGAVLLARQEP
ncbi:MAG: iron ABC transporter permease [Rhodospirillales bacterium 20-60-12]|nr:MAG: iron ABC transporter permease [Rhodospirillales bacterium 20-60-12]HQT66282.1 iron ABC transporter permease [Acetobacteraceae bacterium]